MLSFDWAAAAQLMRADTRRTKIGRRILKVFMVALASII